MIFFHKTQTNSYFYVIIKIQLSVARLKKGANNVDNQNSTTMPSDENNSLDVVCAADLFSRLSPESQDAIIDLIKSLLSEK